MPYFSKISSSCVLGRILHPIRAIGAVMNPSKYKLSKILGVIYDRTLVNLYMLICTWPDLLDSSEGKRVWSDKWISFHDWGSTGHYSIIYCAENTEAGMLLNQLRGIDPILSSYHLLVIIIIKRTKKTHTWLWTKTPGEKSRFKVYSRTTTTCKSTLMS